MRQYTKSWISNLFLGALTLSFVTWGIGDIFRGGSGTAVATVGRTSIDQSEFQRDYTNYIRRAGEQRGKDITPEEARKQNLGASVLQQDIARAALDNLTRERGLTASDAMVSTQIQSIPAFAGITGKFDHTVFEQRIQRIGYNEQGFIELVRQDTVRDQLIHATESGYAIPSGYARAIFAYSTEVRAAQYVTVDAKSLPPIAPPSDAVLAAFVKAHPDQFSTPEYRDVTYAEISPADVAATTNVTDKQISDAYDNNKDKFVIAEKRELQQIVFPSQGDAAAARAKIAAGTTFDQTAIARGEQPSDTALGDLVAADLDPSQSGPVFALPAGGVSQPLKTAAGWALIRVVKITPGKTTTLDQARDQIKTALVQEMSQAKLTDIANAYTDASSGGLSLEQAARKVGMRTGRISAMDSNGLARDGSKTAAPDDPEFRALVFKTEVGEEGDPVSTKSGSLYVVSVNGIVPPKVKPLDAVRAQALAAWSDGQRSILLQKKAAELAAMANRDKSLDRAATSIHAPVQTSQALNRVTSDATFSPEIVAALFNAAAGQTVFGPKGSGGDYIVARVSGIVHPLPPVGDPNYVRGMRAISEGVASGITDSLSAAAQADQGVKINNKLFTTVMGNEGS